MHSDLRSGMHLGAPALGMREKEKKRKYQGLDVDLATQCLGWKVTISPLVMGDLGTVGGSGRNSQ